MFKSIAIAAALAFCAAASAQTVEYRIIERTGRTMVTGTADAQLNFAVQARVRNAAPNVCLGQFGFDIHLLNEPEASGTLARGLISNFDHTYATTIGINSIVGRGGLASQFTMLAGLSSNFNGLFNTTSGPFVNTPDNEIGVIGGAVQVSTTAGTDLDDDGVPDGMGPDDLFYSFPPAVASTYLGAGGNWCDVYRFRYTLTSFTPRTLVLRVQGASANVFTQLEINSNWFPYQPVPAGVFLADLAIGVGGQFPAGVCCDLTTGACSLYVAGACDGGFVSASSCTPSPCVTPGSCCLQTGACTINPQATCTSGSIWTAGGSCTPNPCPPTGKCCGPAHGCFVRIQSACLGPFTLGQTCTPNDCPSDLGRCCDSTGWCAYTTESACTATFASGNSTCTTSCPPTGACCQTSGACLRQVQGCTGWVAGTVCMPNPCAQPGRCCATNGTCSLKLQSACTTGPWSAGSSCTPNPCPPVSRCCASSGACTLVIPGACTGVFTAGATCSPACPQPGRCCSAAGVCTLVLQSACTTTFSVGTCTTGVCAQLGGCCQGFVCTTTISTGCTGDGRVFKGAGTVCGSSVNPIACCTANFNQVDGLTPTDVFDYINAWFAQAPATDTDHDGTITIADLTMFFNLWMSGCGL